MWHPSKVTQHKFQRLDKTAIDDRRQTTDDRRQTTDDRRSSKGDESVERAATARQTGHLQKWFKESDLNYRDLDLFERRLDGILASKDEGGKRKEEGRRRKLCLAKVASN
jgi:hypothetical protein